MPRSTPIFRRWRWTCRSWRATPGLRWSSPRSGRFSSSPVTCCARPRQRCIHAASPSRAGACAAPGAAPGWLAAPTPSTTGAVALCCCPGRTARMRSGSRHRKPWWRGSGAMPARCNWVPSPRRGATRTTGVTTRCWGRTWPGRSTRPGGCAPSGCNPTPPPSRWPARWCAVTTAGASWVLPGSGTSRRSLKATSAPARPARVFATTVVLWCKTVCAAWRGGWHGAGRRWGRSMSSGSTSKARQCVTPPTA